MAFVVCEPCHDCKYTDCVVVCPMECFYQGGQMLYIDPDSCIDCGACVPECPVEAIYRDDAVPTQWRSYIDLNRERTQALISLPNAHVTEKQEPRVGDGCRGPR